MPSNHHNHSTTSSEQRWPFLHTSKHSFTLIELVLVLAMVLIMASIGITTLVRPATEELSATLQELEMLCRCAQYSACASNQRQVVVIAPDKKTCSLTTKHGVWQVILPTSCCFGTLPNVFGPPGDPTKKIVQPVTFPTENNQLVIIFQQTGVISPGTAYIIDKDKQLLGALTCGVSQVSYIRRYLYQSHKWQLLKT